MLKNLTKLNAWLIIIIFILAIIIIDAFIYIGARNENGVENTNNLDNSMDTVYTDMVNNVRQTNEADSKTWKTYSNKEYGFELKYPNYYGVDIPLLSSTEKEKSKIEAYILFIYDQLASQITIAIHNKTAEDVIFEIAEFDKSDLQEINIGGRVGKKIIITKEGKSQAIIIFEEKGRAISVMSDDSPVFSKFLETIIFTQ